jgi:hypothetical protein
MFLGSEKDVQSLEELVNEILPALFYLDQKRLNHLGHAGDVPSL